MQQAKDSIRQAQERQAKYADEHRRDIQLKQGDMVMLSTANLNVQHRASKLLPQFYGPFKVKRVVSPVAYELELPSSMRIHPVFHVSRLKRYIDGSEQWASRPQPMDRPEPDVLPNGEEAWEVDKIVDKRVRRVGRNRRPVTEYLVLWRGYPEWERSWEPAANLRAARGAVARFEAGRSVAQSSSASCK